MLVDGATAFARVAERLTAARSHVHITGWHLEPSFELVRDRDPPVVLGRLLAELAETIDVRVLLWAGAPVPLFHPTRAEVRAISERLCASTRIRCALDSRERPMHCHHEKTIVIDDEVAFVGGIDLTNLAGDRFDTSDAWRQAPDRLARRRRRSSRGPWSATSPSISSCAGARSPARRSLARFICRRPARSRRRSSVPCPRAIYDAVADGDFRVLETYVRALRGARRFIYLENQFLWSPEIVDVLRRKLRDPPRDEFRIVVLLPAKPNNGQDDTRGQLAVLAQADDHAGRFLADDGALAQR